MSNFPPNPLPPSPYSSPGYATPGYPMPPGYSLMPTGMAAARRAGVLVIVLGCAMILGGGCFSAVGLMLPKMQLPPETQAQFNQLQARSGASLSMIAMAVAVMGGVGVACGIVQAVLGIFVRLGGRASTIGAIIITALLLMFLLFASLSNMISGDASQLGSGVCMLAVGGSLLVWQLLWLIAALREASTRQGLAASYQAQYWQYQQQQQAFQQPYPPGTMAGGWAYGTPPPPPPVQPPQGPTQHYPTGEEKP